MEGICPMYLYMDITIYHCYEDSYPDWADWFWYDVISCS